MCVSANVSFLVAGALGTVGLASLAKVKRKNELPYALIPIFFAIQQISEGLIWLSHPEVQAVSSCAVSTYSFFAYAFWPLYAPVAVLCLEPTKNVRMRIWMYLLVLFGAFVSLRMLFELFTAPVSASVVQGSLVYTSSISSLRWIQSLYAPAVCLPSFFSSHYWVKIFGVLVVLMWSGTLLWYSYAFHSIWCFASAIVSVAVYKQFASK